MCINLIVSMYSMFMQAWETKSLIKDMTKITNTDYSVSILVMFHMCVFQVTSLMHEK